MQNVEDLHVGQRFTFVGQLDEDGANEYPEQLIGLRGTVVKINKNFGGGGTFDVKFDTKLPDALAWYETYWHLGFWTGKHDGFHWGADYFDHDWDAAANRHRDEIFRHLFSEKAPSPRDNSTERPF